MTKFFSVIIPTYNRAAGVKRALDSLARQTFTDFEVLVCDDGSTDETATVVKGYSDVLDITYLWAENWGGPARPRNLGIEKSVGKWICFLDSDDWWYPSKLEECFKFTQEFDFIYHYLDIIDEKDKGRNPKRVSRPLNNNVLKELTVNGNCIANSSVLIRASIVKQAGKIAEDRDLIAVEDYDYWLRVAEITGKFKFIAQSLGAYNWGEPSNISHISLNRIEKERNIFNKYVKQLGESDIAEAESVFSYKIGRYYGMLGDFQEARRLLKIALLSKSLEVKIKAFIYLMYFRFPVLKKHSK